MNQPASGNATGERPLRYLSVCSGIEAASVAWHPLGFEPVALAEIEAFPSAVLKHHYPTVPNWGDLSKFKKLQGFPTDYTLIQYRGKPAKDAPRYKALGNSMAVPVMAWIGRRIKEVDSLDVALGAVG